MRISGLSSQALMAWIDRLPSLSRYIVAFILPFIALGLTLLLQPIIQPLPGVFFFTAISLAAWISGLLPSLLAVVVSVIMLDYFFLSPGNAFTTSTDIVTLSIFGLVAILVSWIENQRRTLSDQLLTSRNELKDIIDSVADAITVQKSDGTVEMGNAAAAMLTGYGSSKNLAATPVSNMHQRFKIFNEDNQQITMAQLPRVEVFSDGHTRAVNLRMDDVESGIQRWLEIKTSPLFDAHGNVRRVVNIFRDITKAKKIEQMVAEERLRLRRVLDEINVFVAMLTPDGIIVEANHAGLGNLSADELIGTKFYEMPGWKYDLAVPQRIQQAIERAAKGELVRFDIQTQLNPLQSLVTIDFTIAPIYNDAGEVEFLIPSGIDITERYQREQEMAELADLLEHERERLARIVNTIPSIVFEAVDSPADKAQRMVFVSDYAEKMLGYPLSEWLDNPEFVYRYLHPDDLEKTIKTATEVYNAGETGVLEYRMFDAQGAIVHIEGRSTMLRDDSGTVTGVIGVLTDISDRKQSEQAIRTYARDLNRSNAELEQFAYVASHDLQEPLRMVGSYLQLIEQRYGDRLDGDAREFINYAVDGATRMKKLIQDLLTFSRVQRSTTHFQTLDMNDVLSQAKRNLQFSLEETHAVLTCDILPVIYGSESQLVQVFQNLIGNALKFCGESTPLIHVSALEHSEEWEFMVADNGIGIEAPYLDRIFIIFQRLHSREQYPGTGIGLSICRKIVDQHGGRIWAESKPDEGTTFHFTIAKQII